MTEARRHIQIAWLLTALSVLAATALAGKAFSSGTLDIRHHELDVRLDPDSHRLEGFDRISFVADERVAYSFYLGLPLTITRATLDGRRAELERIEIEYETEANAQGQGKENDPEIQDHPENRVMYRLPIVKPGDHVLEVEYEGVVYDTLTIPEGSRSLIPSETTGLIDGEGSYLSGGETGWYPDGGDVYAQFSIRVTTPTGIESVTEGKRVAVQRKKKETITDWEVNYPTQHVTLMAGPYVVRDRDFDGITLMAYFFPSEEELIDTYLDACEGYIELYNKLIGPYPFSKFAVVENFFPTGYGMPSYTLLGRRIIRMPFIVRTSLGHEVVHNWWGNCVYPDYEVGNWCEGLATYYADYRYEVEKGDSAAVHYRRDISIDYATHVTDTTDVALVEFRSREDAVTGVVGYGKCLMVFHMLSRQMGEDRFYRAMRNFYRQYRFQEANWKDIESVLEEAFGEPLDAFFDQWVRGTGAPRLTLDDVRLEAAEGETGKYDLRITIGNQGGFVLPRVPVEIGCRTVTRTVNVSLAGEAVQFDWRLDEAPLKVTIDPNYDIFRKLDPAEIPVTINRVLADDAAVIVIPSSVTEEKASAYRELADRLNSDDEMIVEVDTAFAAEDLTSRAVFILGGVGENGVYDLLAPPDYVVLDGGGFEVEGAAYTEPGHAAFVALTNPLEPSQTVCSIVGNSADAVKKAGYKVIYYGKYSYVTFFNGDKQDAGIFPVTANPLVYRFNDADINEAE